MSAGSARAAVRDLGKGSNQDEARQTGRASQTVYERWLYEVC